MVRTCAHLLCKNNDRKKEGNVGFHIFPKATFELWLKCSGRSSPTGKLMFLCSKHFAGGNGPTKENPHPLDYVGAPTNVLNVSTTPRLRKKKEHVRHEAARALLELSTAAPSNSEWEDLSIEEEFGDSIQSSTFGESQLMDESVDCNSGMLVPEDGHAIRLSLGRRKLFSSPRKPIFRPKRFPWELMSPSPKRFKMYHPLPREDSCENLLGCQELQNSPNNSLHEQSADDILISASQDTWDTLRGARRSLQLDGDLPLENQPGISISSKKDSEGGTTSKVKESRSIGVQCDLGLSYWHCKHMPEKDFKFFTGVTQPVFEVIYDFIGGDEVCYSLKYSYDRGTPQKLTESSLSPKDRLFLTLIRLRRGIPLRDLGFIFKMSTGEASKIFFTWIRLLSLSFQKLQDAMFISAASQKDRPKCFRKFGNLRAIIDCFEIRIQKPWNFEKQGNTYSTYKSSNTVKILLAMSCKGSISFVSEAYEGSISDRQIVLQSGFLNHLHPSDAIMADRGFNIEAELNEIDVELLIPPFLGKRNKLSPREIVLSKAIASSRVHVERVIGKLKDYRLIRGVVPNTMLPLVSDIVFVVSCLVNFETPFF